jgi:penicillin-binding protein 1A
VRRPELFRPSGLRWVAVLCLVGTAGACSWQARPLQKTPSTPLAESSQIFAADGTLITTLHGEQNRQTVPLDRIPKVLRDAVVAIEDERFWQHRGVDAKALLRAIYANASSGKVLEGGSTITQQYVKNEVVGNDRNVRRKVQEAALAYQLEQRYTKERILELYLNTIYFGNGAYGVEAAARQYFGVGVESLSLGQAALLAGLIRAPNNTDPYEQPDAAAARRKVVLDKLLELKWASPQQVRAAEAEPLVAPKAPGPRYPAPHFVERVKRLILDDPRFGPTPRARQDLLFAGGLRIYTTIDLKRQAQAEQAINRVLPGSRDPAAALVSLEPGTGYVRALVGGRDFFGAGPQAAFDLATQGRRPAGSAFKPFVLATALQSGVPLSKTYDGPPRLTIPLTNGPWEVENYEGGGGGRMDLVDATVRSVNTVYAQLILEVGPAQAVATAARMGIASPLQPYPSAVLGTNDVSPLEMASAYATLANRGVAVPPTFVTKVVRRDGTLLYEHHHTEKRALERAIADTEVDLLRQVVERGTAVDARIGRPAAGKTGTGQQWRDAWFVGFTPDLATSVWVGFPDRQVSMVPPTTRVRVTGGSWPAQIWQLYMTAALAEVPISQFSPPGKLATGDQALWRVVPSVFGMPVGPAEEALSREGFLAVRRLRGNDEYPPGYVVGQTPGAGSQAPGGSVVTLEVSTGPPTARVPDLLGLTQEEARRSLAASGLQTKVVMQPEPKSPGSGSRKGRVWKQSPQGGMGADRGETVTIYVNRR